MKFDFEDTGTGQALLFIPGSYSTHAAWKGVIDALGGTYRTITTSLPGYGDSEEFRDANANDMSGMVEFVASVIDRIDQPVHLVGHSYGGLTLFASMLVGKIAPLSAITFEGNPIYSRRQGQPFPWIDEVRDMTEKFAAAIDVEDPDAASIIVDFWSQTGAFQSMPERFQDYCRAKAATNLMDWRTAAGFSPDCSDYGRIDIPCTIVRGEHANRMIVDISDEIVAQVPVADLRVVPGSGHFLISTHSEECASIIDGHMSQHGFV